MKATILKEKLKEGISIVERIAQKTLQLPILNNVLLKAEKSFISLTTTNLEIGIRWWNLAKIEKEGEILLPVKLLSSFISLLPSGPLELKSEDAFLNIKSKEYSSKIKGFNSEEFPILPQVSSEEKVILSSQAFCQGINQVLDIASPSLTRPEISGLFFQFQKEQLKIVATDSFRLGEKKFFSKFPIEKEYTFILPQLTAREIVNIFGETEEELKIYFSPNQILFESALSEADHPKIQLISRLIEGDFPDYQTIIPKKFESQIIVSRNEFLTQIKSASLFSGKINTVKLEILPEKKGVRVFSQNPDSGEYEGFLAGKIKGKAMAISFNYRFLIDGLLKISSPEIGLELTDEEGPAVLRPVMDEDYLYLVMPIKTS